MEWINGVLKIKIGRKFYNLNETNEIIYDGIEYSSVILFQKIKIPKSVINKLYRNNLIFVFKNDVKNLQVIYKVKPTDCEHIKIKQELYYRGLNWGSKTYCYDKEIVDGKIIVKSNNGVNREEQEVLLNKCDLYTSKKEINKTLIDVYMGQLIK